MIVVSLTYLAVYWALFIYLKLNPTIKEAEKILLGLKVNLSVLCFYGFITVSIMITVSWTSVVLMKRMYYSHRLVFLTHWKIYFVQALTIFVSSTLVFGYIYLMILLESCVISEGVY